MTMKTMNTCPLSFFAFCSTLFLLLLFCLQITKANDDSNLETCVMTSGGYRNGNCQGASSTIKPRRKRKLATTSTTILPNGSTTDTASDSSSSCKDSEIACFGWAEEGECDNNPGYMLQFCKKSCGMCGSDNNNIMTSKPSRRRNSSYSSSGSDQNNRQQQVAEDGVCEDENESCQDWASIGECQKNPLYMHTYCKLSCGICQSTQQSKSVNSQCKDNHENCELWAGQGECTVNPDYMVPNCPLSCFLCTELSYSAEELRRGADMGVPQQIDFEEVDSSQVVDRIKQARDYLQTSDMLPPVRRGCKNKFDRCAEWAVMGKCDSDSDYMKKTCAPVCSSCDYGSVEYRCPLDPNATNIWEAGDLDAMFTRLTQEPYLSQYDVQILSSPALNNGPWVITMENVITEDEANKLIELGTNKGYERSSDVGKMLADGTYDNSVNSGRTSTNTWCTGHCHKEGMSLGVLHRLENITGIPDMNAEYLQLLRYEPGQFYQSHHDYIDYHNRRQCGVRILTLYMYLNDVEEGGGTNFDKLNITVMPKRGRALLWPSVLDESPSEKDDRTTHQALPVEKGIKYGANGWYHLRDFKTPYKNLCT